MTPLLLQAVREYLLSDRFLPDEIDARDFNTLVQAVADALGLDANAGRVS